MHMALFGALGYLLSKLGGEPAPMLLAFILGPLMEEYLRRAMSDAALYDLRERISALALKHRLPTIAYVPEFTDVGALMSYGPPRRAMYRRSADYVKKILAGTKPADLPVEQPTQIELSINLRTAKALGITVPDGLLARADRVVD